MQRTVQFGFRELDRCAEHRQRAFHTWCGLEVNSFPRRRGDYKFSSWKAFKIASAIRSHITTKLPAAIPFEAAAAARGLNKSMKQASQNVTKMNGLCNILELCGRLIVLILRDTTKHTAPASVDKFRFFCASKN